MSEHIPAGIERRTMKIEETSACPACCCITPKIYSDNRGAFWETWNHKTFEDSGLPMHLGAGQFLRLRRRTCFAEFTTRSSSHRENWCA